VGFAPVEAPEIVVVALVEHGGSGSKAAAPITQKVLAAYFGEAVEPPAPAQAAPPAPIPVEPPAPAAPQQREAAVEEADLRAAAPPEGGDTTNGGDLVRH
jgi:penicillin-binding protein 2